MSEPIEDTIRKLALQNAVNFKGKANPKAIAGKILGSHPELRGDVAGLNETIGGIVGGIGETISGTWENLKSGASEAWGNITSTVSGAWENLKAGASEAWGNITSTIGSALDTAKSWVSEKIGNIKEGVGNAWENVKSKTSEVWGNVKQGIGNAIDTAKSWVAEKAQAISKAMGFDGMVPTVGDVFNAAKSKIGDIMGNARDVVSGAIDKITGIFGGANFQLPHINLPHFSISGGFSLNPLSVPHLAIDWYAKGGVFDGPSVIGVGEAGPEAVVPLAGRAMEPYAEAVAGIVADRVGAVSVEIHDCQFAVRRDSDVDAIARAISARVGQQARGRFALS